MEEKDDVSKKIIYECYLHYNENMLYAILMPARAKKIYLVQSEDSGLTTKHSHTNWVWSIL